MEINHLDSLSFPPLTLQTWISLHLHLSLALSCSLFVQFEIGSSTCRDKPKSIILDTLPLHVGGTVAFFGSSNINIIIILRRTPYVYS